MGMNQKLEYLSWILRVCPVRTGMSRFLSVALQYMLSLPRIHGDEPDVDLSIEEFVEFALYAQG